jgi:hypothetical protein
MRWADFYGVVLTVVGEERRAGSEALLSVEDLFTAGIGFDVVGAVLLGKGLLVSSTQQFRKGASGWGGYSFAQALSWSADWVDASFGAAWLVIGFLLQAVGYALVVGGVESTMESERPSSRSPS